MRNIKFIILLCFVTITALAATKVLQGDTWKSADLTKTWTPPSTTQTLVGLSSTDVLTNKTLTAPVISTISNTGTLTLPTSTDTLVGKATTDVFTNKTINASTNTIQDGPVITDWNTGITASVGSNALTITLTDYNDTALDATNISRIHYRNTTLTSAALFAINSNSAKTIVVPSGGTLGHGSGLAHYIYVYMTSNSRLAVSTTLFSENAVYTTVTIGTGSDSNNVIYESTGAATTAIKCIGRIAISEATAGTWSTAPTEVTTGSYADFYPESIIKARYTSAATTAFGNGPTVVAFATLSYDTHNAFNTSNNTYTVPYGGTYRVCAGLYTNGVMASQQNLSLSAVISASATFYLGVTSSVGSASAQNNFTSGCQVIPLSSGATVEIKFATNTAGNQTQGGGASYNHFTIERISN